MVATPVPITEMMSHALFWEWSVGTMLELPCHIFLSEFPVPSRMGLARSGKSYQMSHFPRLNMIIITIAQLKLSWDT